MSSLTELGRRLKEVERKISRGVSQPQLAYSSIEDGNVQEYDRDGTLVGIIGLQHDGTHVAASVNGPIPPTPAAPTALDGPGGITVEYAGNFANVTDLAPMDFLRFDIHTSTTSGFTYDPATTLRASLTSPRGGKVFIPLPAGTHYVRIVTVTASGKYSSASDQDSAIAGSGTGVLTYWQDTAPTAFTVGDLWYKTNEGNLLHRWNGTSWVVSPIGGGAIDTATVTSTNTQFKPGGGMLQNLIPDSQFNDPDWRAKRQAQDGWDTWDFQVITNLIPMTSGEWNFGPKTSSMTFYGSATPEAYFDFNLSATTVAGDVLGYTDPIPVEANYTYQLADRWDSGNSFDMLLQWKDAALVNIGAEINLTTGSPTPQAVLSPAGAAFAVVTFKTDGVVYTTSASVNGAQFYHGGAGLIPGMRVAHILIPAGSSTDTITLARNVPLGMAQQYFGSISYASQYAQTYMQLIMTVEGDPTPNENLILSAPALVGHPATFQTARGYVDPNAESLVGLTNCDIVLEVNQLAGGDTQIWFTDPAFVATGFSTMDGTYAAVFSPALQMMQGDEIQVYIDSFEGLALWQTTSDATAEPMEMGISRFTGSIYWDIGNYASMEMSGSVWKVDTGDLATNQNQHLELNGVTKLAQMKNGLSAIVESALTRAALLFGATNKVQVDSARVDLVAPEVRLGNGTNSATVIGAAVAAGSMQLSSSQVINAIRWGSFSGTTNASGQVTVTHNLGGTPTGVLLTPAFNHKYRVQAQTSTTLTIEGRNASDVVLNAVAVQFFWFAIR